MNTGSAPCGEAFGHKRSRAWRNRRTALIGGLLLVLGGTLAERSPEPASSVGEVPPVIAAGQARSAPRVGFTSDTPVVPPSAIRSARLADLPIRARARPVQIRIATLGLRALIAPVGVDTATGIMEVPASVATVGWYRFGATAGGPGVTLIVGHVDSSTQGRGAFFALGSLRPGAVVAIRSTDGSSHSFKIVAIRSYPKGDLPPRLFAKGGAPLLALVTCGGPFDHTTRHYADNVVAYGVPVAANGHGKSP
jgi:hypothetical protein